MEDTVHPTLAGDIRLFETMRADGDGVALLDLHLDRLCESCRVFGVPFGRRTMTDAVNYALNGQPQRLRLSVAADGAFEIERFVLPPASGAWRVGLAAQRVQSGDIWRAHKTTHRGIYDTARENMPPGTQELLFLNQKGELAEGTITNLFADPGNGVLHTPPVSAGALPGVLRRSLIEAGRARVARLRPADLAAAKHVFVGNALRGLIPVSLDIPRLS